MLAITLETQQPSLFPKQHNNGLNYELEVVNQGPHAEIKVYFLSNKKRTTPRRSSKKIISKNEAIFLFKP